MPILNKAKLTPPQPAPAPSFTPGQLTPDAMSQLAQRRVRYGLQTGRDEYGNSTGKAGFIEQQRLGKVGDINARRAISQRDRTEGLLGADRGFAARGMGRSGLLGVARGKVESAALDREGEYSRAEEAANLGARMENADEDFNFANDTSSIRQAGGAAAYQQWLEQNPNQGAQGSSARNALPDWNSWVKSHPWAKTPAQKKILRANYDAMVART